jgi:hypothetical protein
VLARDLPIQPLSAVKKLAVLAVFAVAALLPGHARAADCGIPDRPTQWIDFSSPNFTGWKQFARTGVAVAASGSDFESQLRAGGAATAWWDMHLTRRVGTPTAPASPMSIQAAANEVFGYAVTQAGCPTPMIAENELFGAGTTTPWSASNAQYRANVLAYLQALAARGARPVLLVNSQPYTGGDARAWWQQVGQTATIVQEYFTNSQDVAKLDPLRASRQLRVTMRQAVAPYLAIGIPASRLGLMLEFESGSTGRAGLQPATAWFDVVKLEALAARQVAWELSLGSVWSWGWGNFSASDADADKPIAACVYLWARAPFLCAAPGLAGAAFDRSLSEGQIIIPAGSQCTVAGTEITKAQVAALSALTDDWSSATGALLERTMLRQAVAVPASDVLAAERSLVALGFGGSRSAYDEALATAHISEAGLRDVLADGLRRSRIESALRVAAPTDQQVLDFYRTYRSAPVRHVSGGSALPWPGSSLGLAIGSLAPAQLFSVPAGQSLIVRTLQGTFSVRVYGQPVTLGSLPLAQARPAILAALAHFSQVSAYAGWLGARENAALSRAVCLGDRLPPVGPVDLARYLPFLATA